MMKKMKQNPKEIRRRVVCFFLSVLMVITGIIEQPGHIVHADERVSSDGKWSISINWGDPSDNLPDNWCPVYGSEETITIKTQVTVECANSEGKVYNPGDISINLSDVFGIDEFDHSYLGRYSKSISAIKAGSSGTGDWYYTESLNSTTGCYDYVFTNKNTINTSFTSTFQIVLTFSGDTTDSSNNYAAARHFTVGYEQDVIATLNADGHSIQSNTLHYSWQGSKDTYDIAWGEAENLAWGNSILSKIPKDDWNDYIYINLKLNGSMPTYSSIAIQDGNYVALDLGAGVIVGTPYKAKGLSYLMSKDHGWSYETFLENCDNTRGCFEGTTSIVRIPVAVPRSYLNTNGGVTQFTANWYGTYYGETSEVLLDSDTMSINLNSFDTEYTGELYALEKRVRNPYENYSESMKYFYNKPALGGIENLWDIGVTAVYYGKPYNAVIGDDLHYIVYKDNTYRRLENDEKVVSSVTLYKPTNVDKCDYEIYGRLLGGSGNYELVKTGTLSSSTSGMGITVSSDANRYYDVKVKLLGLTASLEKSKTLVSFRTYFFDNDSLDGGKTITDCYNFSYLQIEVDDTLVPMEYDAVTNMSGLDTEILAFDETTYHKTVLREADSVDIKKINYRIDAPIDANNYTFEYTSGETELVKQIRFNNIIGNDSEIPTTINFYQTKIVIPSYIKFDSNSLKFKPRTLSSYSPSVSAFSYSEEELENLENINISVTETIENGNTVIYIDYDLADNPIISEAGKSDINTLGVLFDCHVSLDDYYMLGLNNTTSTVYHYTTKLNVVNNYTGLSYKADVYNSNRKFSYPDIARNSFQGIEIEVAKSDGLYTKDTIKVENNENYSYKIRLSSGETRMADVVLYSNIENYIPEAWKGSYKGYSFEGLERAGVDTSNFKVYYSSNRSQTQDITKDGWVLSSDWTDDLSEVKSVAFDLEGYILESDSLMYLEYFMNAPGEEQGITLGEITKNQATVSYIEYDSTDTNLDIPLKTTTNLPSNIVGVSLGDIVVNVSVNKIWDDNNNKDGLRPSFINIHLYRNGEEIDNYSLRDSEDWKHDFTGLLKYDEDLNEYEYTITEEKVAGYIGSIEYIGEDINTTVIITNTLEKVNISGTKTWKDEENKYSSRPDSITINLLRDEVKVDSITIDDSNEWKYEFKDLTKYSSDGTPYDYEIQEDFVAGYSVEYNKAAGKGGIRLTFSSDSRTENVKYDFVQIIYKKNGNYYEAAKLGGKDISGAIVDIPATDFYLYWKTDGSVDNYYGYKIDSVEIINTEIADGTKCTLPSTTVVETEVLPESVHGNYGNALSELYHYDSGLSLDEKIIDIVNTYEHVSISGSKIWEDDDNSQGIRPDAVTIHLLRDGIKVKSVTTDASKNWKYSFEGLPKFNGDHVDYIYSLEEEAVEGYAASYEKKDVKGIRLTFSSDSRTESVNYDYVQIIYQKDGNYYQAAKLGGSAIANAVVEIPSTDFYLYWKTDGSSCNYYGYKIDSIEAIDTDISEGTSVNLPDVSVIETDILPESVHDAAGDGYGNNLKELYHYNSGFTSQYNVKNTLIDVDHELVIVKSIEKSAIWWEHGNPIFIFKIEGNGVTRYVSMEFTKEMVDNFSGDKNEVRMSVTLTLSKGDYTVTEVPVMRWKLKKVKSDAAKSILDDGAVIDLSQNATVEFFNEYRTYSGLSHCAIVVNKIGEK